MGNNTKILLFFALLAPTSVKSFLFMGQKPARLSDTGGGPCKPMMITTRRCSLAMMENDGDFDFSNNEQEENGPVFFNDFCDEGFLGDSSSSSSSESLVLRQVQDRIQEAEQRVEKNWQSGSWQVRGFSLDPFSAHDERSIFVSKIVSCPDHPDVYVGRTDGTLFRISLGTEYMASFTSSNDSDKKSFKSYQHLKRNDESERRSSLETPFEILSQTEAHSTGKPLSTILPVNDDEVYTVSSNEIKKWTVVEETYKGSGTLTLTETAKLEGLPTTADVVHLGQVTWNGRSSVLCIARDGSVGIWEATSCALLDSCTFGWEGVPIHVTCATSDSNSIVIGNEIGQLMVYKIANLKDSIQQSPSNLVSPDLCWSGFQQRATSVTFGGPGSFSRGPDAMSSILLSGAQDGSIRQWELFSQGERLEYWPKLASQRMPKRSHQFLGHSSDVTALEVIDATKFLSASKDGSIRAWDATSGKELFRMDGFSSSALGSLCVKDDLLVTDGMENFVCVNDFDIDFSGDNDIDLDAW